MTIVSDGSRLLELGNVGAAAAVCRGSSIMPGKINPTIPEIISRLCQQIIGLDRLVAEAVYARQFEINIFVPVVAHNLLEAIIILAGGIEIFTKKTLPGLPPNFKQMAKY